MKRCSRYMKRACEPAVIVVRPQVGWVREVIEPGVAGEPVERGLADAIEHGGGRSVVGALDHRPQQVTLARAEGVVADVRLAQQRDHEHHLHHAGRVVDSVGVGAVQLPGLVDDRERDPAGASVGPALRRRDALGPRVVAGGDAAWPRLAVRTAARATLSRPAIQGLNATRERAHTGYRRNRRAAHQCGVWSSGDGKEDLSDTTAPSIGPNTTFEKDDPEERLAASRAVGRRRDGTGQAPRGHRRQLQRQLRPPGSDLRDRHRRRARRRRSGSSCWPTTSTSPPPTSQTRRPGRGRTRSPPRCSRRRALADQLGRGGGHPLEPGSVPRSAATTSNGIRQRSLAERKASKAAAASAGSSASLSS